MVSIFSLVYGNALNLSGSPATRLERQIHQIIMCLKQTVLLITFDKGVPAVVKLTAGQCRPTGAFSTIASIVNMLRTMHCCKEEIDAANCINITIIFRMAQLYS